MSLKAINFNLILENLLNKVLIGFNYFLTIACIPYAYKVVRVVTESDLVNTYNNDDLLLKSYTPLYLMERFNSVPNL